MSRFQHCQSIQKAVCTDRFFYVCKKKVGESIVVGLNFPARIEINTWNYPNSSLRQSLKLDETPIFVWSNPRRMGGQAGHVWSLAYAAGCD